jgi:hypothetical protein
MHKRKYSNKKIISVLNAHGGIIKTSADELKITRKTLYSYINENPELKEAWMDAKESALDEAETSLITQVRDLNTAATIFFLKTLGKDRGYTERKELDLNPGGRPIVINKIKGLADMDNDQLKAEYERLFAFVVTPDDD